MMSIAWMPKQEFYEMIEKVTHRGPSLALDSIYGREYLIQGTSRKNQFLLVPQYKQGASYCGTKFQIYKYLSTRK